MCLVSKRRRSHAVACFDQTPFPHGYMTLQSYRKSTLSFVQWIIRGKKGSWCLALISYCVVKSYEGLKMHTWDPNVQNYKQSKNWSGKCLLRLYIKGFFSPYILTSQESPPAGQESSTSLITQSRIFNLFNESLIEPDRWDYHNIWEA